MISFLTLSHISFVGDEDYAPREAVAEVPSPMCPLVTEPDIDIEVYFFTTLTTVNAKWSFK